MHNDRRDQVAQRLRQLIAFAGFVARQYLGKARNVFAILFNGGRMQHHDSGALAGGQRFGDLVALSFEFSDALGQCFRVNACFHNGIDRAPQFAIDDLGSPFKFSAVARSIRGQPGAFGVVDFYKFGQINRVAQFGGQGIERHAFNIVALDAPAILTRAVFAIARALQPRNALAHAG